MSREKCKECHAYLQDVSRTVTFAFIISKDMGGLVQPAREVFEVVKISNQVLREYLKTRSIFTDKHIQQKLRISTQNVILQKCPSILSKLQEHSSSILDDHKVKMIKKIVTRFFSIELKHLCKERNNLMSSRARHMHKKIVLFRYE